MRDSADFSVSMGVATAAAVLAAVPPITLLAGIHRALHGPGSILGALDAFLANPWIWAPALVVGVIVHELIHGLTWAWAARRPLGAIRFGVNWKALAPHAQCTVPLPASAYRLGAAAPGLVLGVVPALAGTITGAGAVAAFGWLMVLGAGGDIVVLWLIRNVEPATLLQDHPTRAGCVIAGDASPG